ncbi:FecR family protein [Methylobacillus arboreus]|uniref:FecR domain-containing protein n=1 Tax=Methylobacillus arboreus TaxID=755170 RepID=UPI001E57671A|nr:FecR family protein [Methylobacillus arboreus]MCB5190940.1 FecR family protein [Methylobacillus arboreus]
MAAAPATEQYVRLRQQALEWQVALWSGEVTADQRSDFDEWLAASDLHRQAWSEITAIEQKLRLIPTHAAGLLKDKPDAEKRRRLLQLLGLAAVTGGTVPIVRNSDAWQTWAADHHTHTGEQQLLALSDGSQVILNTSTAVDIEFNSRERRLVLHHGEMYIRTAADAGQPVRPFLVQTRHGVAQALGTRFNVRLKQEETRVSVHDGAVQIQPRLGAGHRLESGLQAGFSTHRFTAATPNGNEIAWLEGKLVAERMRLGDFLDELGRYRRGTIHYDAKAADMVVSGVFPLPDTDRILESLLQALPLRVSYFSRYWVSVHGL